MGTAIKRPVLDRVKPSLVIFDIRAKIHCQKLQKMTAYLTRSGTGCFIAVGDSGRASKGKNHVQYN